MFAVRLGFEQRKTQHIVLRLEVIDAYLKALRLDFELSDDVIGYCDVIAPLPKHFLYARAVLDLSQDIQDSSSISCMRELSWMSCERCSATLAFIT